MPSGYREPAPEPPDPAAEERWQQSMDEAKARQAARRVRRAGTLALLALLLAGMLGGCFAASRVRGGDSPLSGLGDALERIAVGLLVGWWQASSHAESSWPARLP